MSRWNKWAGIFRILFRIWLLILMLVFMALGIWIIKEGSDITPLGLLGLFLALFGGVGTIAIIILTIKERKKKTK